MLEVWLDDEGRGEGEQLKEIHAITTFDILRASERHNPDTFD